MSAQKKDKRIHNLEELTQLVRSNQTIMSSGFMGVGGAVPLMNYLSTLKLENLHMICSDACYSGKGIGALLKAHSVSKLTSSHVGLNKDVSTQVNEGTLSLTLVPQGSLLEQIRCGGAGLGGALTPTGLGTAIAEGKQVVNVEGKNYLLELPLRADVALLQAHKADTRGNLVINKTCRNFNLMMATAADIVIVQVDEVVKVGEIDPNHVIVPHVFIDYLVPRDLLKEYEGVME